METKNSSFMNYSRVLTICAATLCFDEAITLKYMDCLPSHTIHLIWAKAFDCFNLSKKKKKQNKTKTNCWLLFFGGKK